MQIVGIDETSLRRGQHYITVVHDLGAKRLLFANEGRDHQTVLDFAAESAALASKSGSLETMCNAGKARGISVRLRNGEF